ncbi:MAG: hypothetical protein SVY53_01105 [Chloroflexota bacterium]|nr:hypothetical protein [Chloroflexota bacterium]
MKELITDWLGIPCLFFTLDNSQAMVDKGTLHKVRALCDGVANTTDWGTAAGGTSINLSMVLGPQGPCRSSEQGSH